MMTDRVGTEMREGFVCLHNNSFGVRERERVCVCVFRNVSVNLGVCVRVCSGMCV